MTPVATSAPLEDEVNAFFRHDPRLLEDPWPLYRRLREEAPVFRHADKLLVSRWADARSILVAPSTLQGLSAKGTRFRNAAERLDEEHRVELAEMFGFLEKRLGGANGERHTRLRALAQKAFTPKMIALMEQRITEVAETLLEPLLGRDEVDVIEEFAYHLPLIVISQMLDIPTEDRERLRTWANDLGQFVGANWHEPDAVERGHAAVFNLRTYLSSVFESRRGRPTTDLLGALLAAEGDDGDRFTEDELVAMITQFVFAGHETTTNTIGNGLVSLLRDHRDQWAEICADPSLVPGAVEEILRYSPPTHNIEKLIGEDGELHGVPVRRFDSLSVLLAAANRDPEVFPDPDRFDIHRSPNPHITFGFGAHHCIGASLARMETQIALRLFARTFPEMRLEREKVEWRPNHMLRGPEELRLVLGPTRVRLQLSELYKRIAE